MKSIKHIVWGLGNLVFWPWLLGERWIERAQTIKTPGEMVGYFGFFAVVIFAIWLGGARSIEKGKNPFTRNL